MKRRALVIAGAAVAVAVAGGTATAISVTAAEPTREERLMSVLADANLHPAQDKAVEGAQALCDATKLGLPPYLMAAKLSEDGTVDASTAAHIVTSVIDLYCPNAYHTN